jgi:hypothetical protein
MEDYTHNAYILGCCAEGFPVANVGVVRLDPAYLFPAREYTCVHTMFICLNQT